MPDKFLIAMLLALAERAKVLEPWNSDDESTIEQCLDLNKDICKTLGWKVYNETECEWQAPNGDIQQPPLYSSSWDAAFTLIPDEHDWIVGDVNGFMGGTPWAQVGLDTCHAETALLSLVAAALTARARML